MGLLEYRIQFIIGNWGRWFKKNFLRFWNTQTFSPTLCSSWWKCEPSVYRLTTTDVFEITDKLTIQSSCREITEALCCQIYDNYPVNRIVLGPIRYIIKGQIYDSSAFQRTQKKNQKRRFDLREHPHITRNWRLLIPDQHIPGWLLLTANHISSAQLMFVAQLHWHRNKLKKLSEHVFSLGGKYVIDRQHRHGHR